jgi:hypothetical protein
MRKFVAALVLMALMAAMVSGLLLAQGAGTAKRRPPPKSFDKRVEDAFFKDVAKQHGDGTFNDVFSSRTIAKTPSGMIETPMTAGNANSGWSKIISAEALENEIKAAINAVGPNVESKAKWNTGHRKVRNLYSTMAICFGVIAQFDATVKFQKEATALRDVLAKSAANSKVNDERAMIEAKKLLAELIELRNGGSVSVEPASGDSKPYGVSEVAEVMKRMQICSAPEADESKGIERWTSDAARFKGAANEVAHEAQVLAMLAKVLQDPNTFDEANNEVFAKFAKDIEEACQEIGAATKSGNYDVARAAAGKITKACTGCHGAFR